MCSVRNFDASIPRKFGQKQCDVKSVSKEPINERFQTTEYFRLFKRKSLADLAIWEPKSFESLAMIARERAVQDGLYGINEKDADNRVFYYNNEQLLEREKFDNLTPSNYSTKFKNKVQY